VGVGRGSRTAYMTEGKPNHTSSATLQTERPPQPRDADCYGIAVACRFAVRDVEDRLRLLPGVGAHANGFLRRRVGVPRGSGIHLHDLLRAHYGHWSRSDRLSAVSGARRTADLCPVRHGTIVMHLVAPPRSSRTVMASGGFGRDRGASPRRWFALIVAGAARSAVGVAVTFHRRSGVRLAPSPGRSRRARSTAILVRLRGRRPRSVFRVSR